MSGKNVVLCNVELCSGCMLCVYACSASREGVFGPAYSRIHVFRRGVSGSIAVSCLRCPNPMCVESCPNSALTQDGEGLIHVDPDMCVGCGLCVEACPVSAMTLHPDTGKPITCDLCGGEPVCVRVCPRDALTLVSREEAEGRMPQISKLVSEFGG